MKKVLLCGLKYDYNFGDCIINTCTKKMIEEELKYTKKVIKINEIDLYGRDSFESYYKINKGIIYYLRKLIYNILSLIYLCFKKIKIKKMENFIYDIKWYFSEEFLIYKKYYKKEIMNSDYIIIVGGGLIMYKYLNLYHYISQILKYSKKYNKIVYINAVGIEGYDTNNRKCRRLKDALNYNCLKMITTRDDIEKLKLYINNPNTIIDRVADPACLCSEIYNIKKKKSNTIGLCVCRENLFKDNGIDFDGKKMINFWKNLISDLNFNGYKWKIYTNGHKSDNQFAYKLAKELNISKNNVLIPKNEKELIKNISTFSGIIATRLHSNIIAFSLDIPAIGLVWNDKLKYFGKLINYPERYIEIKDFDSKIIIKKLNNAIDEGFMKTDKKYKTSDKEAIKKFICKYIN